MDHAALQEGRPAPAAEGTARLFIALWPPAAVAAALQACGARAMAQAQARREAADRLHLTLHFLGAVPRERLPALRAALCLPFTAFELRFDGCTRWPSGVVVAEPLAPPAELGALHGALAQVLGRLGQRTEARAFRPHVTLARRHAGPWPEAAAGEAALRWRVRAYALVESLAGPPPRYRVLTTCRAQPAAAARGPTLPRCQAAAAGLSLRGGDVGQENSRERNGQTRRR